MDTIEKVLHPKEPTHQTHNTNEPTAAQHHHLAETIPPDARPDQETLDRLGSEPNVTGTNRPPPHEDFPSAHNTTGDKINRGHHHPRQPVGATGPPAGHRDDGAGTGAVGSEAGAQSVKAQAEASNNFPGTNPDPSHTG